MCDAVADFERMRRLSWGARLCAMCLELAGVVFIRAYYTLLRVRLPNVTPRLGGWLLEMYV